MKIKTYANDVQIIQVGPTDDNTPPTFHPAPPFPYTGGAATREHERHLSLQLSDGKIRNNKGKI